MNQSPEKSGRGSRSRSKNTQTMSCPVTSSTTAFALMLEDGRSLKFDSVGNSRAADELKNKQKWTKDMNEGKPIHALLGGARRDRLPAYGTIYPIERTPEGVKRQVEAGKSKNLRAFKLCADPWWMDDLALTGRLLQAARQAAGPDAKLIVDAALSYRAAEDGLRLLPALKDAGIWFLEAPLPLDDVEGHARMAGHGIPLGVGDLGLTHVLEFIEMMDHGGAEICQPDITEVGGFTGILQVAAAALQRGKRVITHGYKTNIEIAANLHFLAAQEREEILEYSLSHSPLRWETTREHFPVEADGCVRVPQAPGLGVSLNSEAVARYRWPATSEAQQRAAS